MFILNEYDDELTISKDISNSTAPAAGIQK